MVSDRRQIRIGIDAREFVETTTGIARLLASLFECLFQLRPEWEFVFFGNSKTVLPFQSRQAKLLRLAEPFTAWWDQVAFVRAIHRERISLFLSPYPKVPLFAPCPVIHIVHDIIHLTNPCYQTLQYLVPRLALSVLGPRYIRKAKITLTDSFYVREELLRRFCLSGQKVRVVYPAIESRFVPRREDTNFKGMTTRYSVRKPYILYVGNFNPHKRVDCLIEAFGVLPEGLRTSTQLVLAGRRSSKVKPLEQRVKRLGLQERVLFTDFVAEGDLPFLYSGATLFVFPSSDEGFGLPPLEAMACGVPVIVGDAASLPEVVGEAGIRVEPGNSQRLSQEMARLLGDREARRRCIQKGFEQVKRFSVDTQSQALLSVLEAILAGGRGV